MKKIGILSLLMVCCSLNLMANGGTVVANYTPYTAFLEYKSDEKAVCFEIGKVFAGYEIVLTHYTPASLLETFLLKVVDASNKQWTWNIQESVETQCYTHGSSKLRTLQIVQEKSRIKIVCYFYQEDDDSRDSKFEFIMNWPKFRQ